MKLSDYIISFLASQKITHVFEVAGGALGHLLDSLYGKKKITAVSMHHEMAAAIAAEGYARASGNIGVAMATSGPGAVNMLTGIGSCFFDSIPCLFITGQVNTYEFKFKKPVRQLGFQETDIVNIARPITKDAAIIVDSGKIKQQLEKLIFTAKSNRPGPVLIDIPLNIQRAEIKVNALSSFDASCFGQKKIDNILLEKTIKLIKSSSRPIALVGGGIRASKAEGELFKFIKKTGIPVVASLMGLDAFPQEDPLFVGLLGSYGNRYSNLAVANSDLLLVLGSRLDTRQTGTNPKTFAREAKIIHVDIDPHELNNKVKADIAIRSDLKNFLSILNASISKIDSDRIKPWKEKISAYKKKYPNYRKSLGDKIDPNYLMYELSKFIPDGAIICADVGQNQMWAAQSLRIKKSQRFLTQGGMASMGSALPMAIGASFAQPQKITVVIIGDGGFQLNIQELETVFHHNLPIKIILLNNHCYGMVRQFQEQYFNSRFQSTVAGYSSPNFQDVVSAYKIPAAKIKNSKEITRKFQKLFADKKPRFLEVNISKSGKVTPKLSVSRPIEDQDPLLPRSELNSNMIIKTIRK